MKLKAKKIMTNKITNIFGEVANCSYRWIIERPRLLRRPMYLRINATHEGEYYNCEWTSYRSHATSFDTKYEAEARITDIKTNPNNYRQ